MKKRKHLRDAAFLAAALILVLVMGYSGLRILESTVFHKDRGSEPPAPGKTILRDGVAYFPRQDLTTVLILGIDQFGQAEQSGSYRNTGAADVNILLIFDETRKSWDVLHLNRDTMLDMPVLGLGGKKAGTAYGQLALAHTYGSGEEDSCRNTVEAVSGLLGNLEIDYYLAIRMDAIAILNDAVGGVTVNVQDDFSLVDPTITLGELTLRGDQAIHFVRSRRDVGDQKNLSRMERQKAYLEGFLEAFRRTRAENPAVAAESWGQIEPYIVTNCTANAISGMAERYKDFTRGKVLSLPGENRMGTEYYEFYPDLEELDRLVLELFYIPKK